MAKVGLAYNLFQIDCLQELPLDCIVELDSTGTIRAVTEAIESRGHDVFLLEADKCFAEKLEAVKPDIIFNMAEGLHGESREAQVPAVCEMYKIPYTGFGVLSLALCLNKAYTNQLLAANNFGIPTFQVICSPYDELTPDMKFPIIVKLNNEGSSMGLNDKSVVFSLKQLRSQADYLIHTYKRPLLVQEFVMGREFTVGVLGNRNPVTLPITESVFDNPYGINLFNLDKETIVQLEQTLGKSFLDDYYDRVLSDHSVCPAEISSVLASRINQVVIRAYKTLYCRDWGRIDLRVGFDDQIYILDVNPIAGISPGGWLPNSAQIAGLDYAAFVNRILDIAIDRVSERNCY